jgi:hypothetical protein
MAGCAPQWRNWEGGPQGGVASLVGTRERGELDLITRDPGQQARSSTGGRRWLIASNTGWTSVCDG